MQLHIVSFDNISYENEIFALKKLKGVNGVIQMLDYGETLFDG